MLVVWEVDHVIDVSWMDLTAGALMAVVTLVIVCIAGYEILFARRKS